LLIGKFGGVIQAFIKKSKVLPVEIIVRWALFFKEIDFWWMVKAFFVAEN
jgi:hypothetical protein